MGEGRFDWRVLNSSHLVPNCLILYKYTRCFLKLHMVFFLPKYLNIINVLCLNQSNVISLCWTRCTRHKLSQDSFLALVGDAKGYLGRKQKTHAKMSVCDMQGWEQVAQ